MERFGLDNVDVNKTFKLSGTCTGIREFYCNIFYSTRPFQGPPNDFSHICQQLIHQLATRLQVLRPETCYLILLIIIVTDTLKIKLALLVCFEINIVTYLLTSIK